MPYKLNDDRRHKFAKATYRVTNWPDYDAALFGGFTPLAATALIGETGSRTAPGAWLSGAALFGLGATLFLYRRAGRR